MCKKDNNLQIFSVVCKQVGKIKKNIVVNQSNAFGPSKTLIYEVNNKHCDTHGILTVCQEA